MIKNFSEDGNKMDDDDPATPAGPGTPAAASGDSPSVTGNAAGTTKYLPFPSSSDLNTRVRRIISAYQKMSRRRAEAAVAALERVCQMVVSLLCCVLRSVVYIKQQCQPLVITTMFYICVLTEECSNAEGRGVARP